MMIALLSDHQQHQRKHQPDVWPGPVASRDTPGGSLHGERANFTVLVLLCSTPPIARVGSFSSIFQDLQDLHSFATLRTQNFRKKCYLFSYFAKENSLFLTIFQSTYKEISPELHQDVSEFADPCLKSRVIHPLSSPLSRGAGVPPESRAGQMRSFGY